MKHLLFILIMPILSFGQPNNLQTFGTVSHFLISCPCKLLKYYDSGQLYYFCKDESLQITYTIKEIKHKDGLDLILHALDQNIYSQKTTNSDSLIVENQSNMITEYLTENPKAVKTNFANYDAAFVDNRLEKKLFFSDHEFIASYEIIIKAQDVDVATQQFNHSINSIRKKTLDFKKIF
jgi:hypothetical protein